MMSAGPIWMMAVAMGIFQGLNPSMGWLLAVGSGLQHRSRRAVLATTWRVAFGHFLSMAALLVPLALVLAAWGARHPAGGHLIRIGWWANFLLIGFGLYKTLRPQHPRFVVRIRPGRWIRWSFWMGLLHCGSPLMMVSSLINLVILGTVMSAGICTGSGIVPVSLGSLMADDVRLAFLICTAMALPLLLTATLVAFCVFDWMGLRALTKCWLNFEALWTVSFFAMAAMGLGMG